MSMFNRRIFFSGLVPLLTGIAATEGRVVAQGMQASAMKSEPLGVQWRKSDDSCGGHWHLCISRIAPYATLFRQNQYLAPKLWTLIFGRMYADLPLCDTEDEAKLLAGRQLAEWLRTMVVELEQLSYPVRS